MNLVLRALLALLALNPLLAWGDGAPVFAMIDTRLDARLEGYNSEPVVAENTDIPVHDEIVNASGQTWSRLCLRLEHMNPAMTVYVPSKRDDSLRFGIEALPDEVWLRNVELRINGIYAGRTGGNWEVVRHLPEAVELVMHAPQIRPGDRVTLRFRLHDSAAIHQWRIRHRAATGSASCSMDD
jgi:hypothetical protein